MKRVLVLLIQLTFVVGVVVTVGGGCATTRSAAPARSAVHTDTLFLSAAVKAEKKRAYPEAILFYFQAAAWDEMDSAESFSSALVRIARRLGPRRFCHKLADAGVAGADVYGELVDRLEAAMWGGDSTSVLQVTDSLDRQEKALEAILATADEMCLTD